MGNLEELEDRIADLFIKVAGAGISSRRGFFSKMGKALFGAVVWATVHPQFALATDPGCGGGVECRESDGPYTLNCPSIYPWGCFCVFRGMQQFGSCVYSYYDCRCCEREFDCNLQHGICCTYERIDTQTDCCYYC